MLNIPGPKMSEGCGQHQLLPGWVQAFFLLDGNQCLYRAKMAYPVRAARLTPGSPTVIDSKG